MLNRTHPLVQRLHGKLDGEGVRHFDLLLESVAASLPVEMVYSDYSTNPRDVSQMPPVENTKERLDDLRKALWGDASGNAEAFREIVRSTRLFDDHAWIVENYIKGGFA